jgi:hypothetical protein
MQKLTGAKLSKKDKIVKALGLRTGGASYSSIGDVLGISKTRAYELVMEGLEQIEKQTHETAEKVRGLELGRLDGIILSHWQTRGNWKSAEVIIRAGERRAKLLGLDAPQKVAETDPNGAALLPALNLGLLTDAELKEMERMYEKAGAVPAEGEAK